MAPRNQRDKNRLTKDPRHDPWDCHRTADQARGGARGVNVWSICQSHGVSGGVFRVGILLQCHSNNCF